MTMNKIIIIGNLGRDPEMRYTPNGQAVTSFSVATNYRYNSAEGEQREETEWFTISTFGRLAETCNQYLSKGQKVYVDGRLRSRSYQARDGETRYVLDVNADQVRFLDRGGGGEGTGGGEGIGGGAEPESSEQIGADDLPF